MSEPTFTHDVFLSHSAKDKAVVRPLAERLRKDGRQGKAECRRQKAEILHSSFFIHPFLRAFGSDWAQLKAGTFRFRDPLNQERRFIPLRLDDAPIKSFLAHSFTSTGALRIARGTQLTDPKGHHDVKLDADALNRFATWMDTCAQRTGHYSEEQEKELVKFGERLAALMR